MTLLSSSISAIQPSQTLAIARKAGEMRLQGKDVINLSQGEPDFDTPSHVREAAIDAIQRGDTRYTNVDGTHALKDAIIHKFERDNGLYYHRGEITVGSGAKQVLFNALVATLDSGDEVIIPAPYWVSYPDMVRLAGGTPVPVVCAVENGFKLTPTALRSAINSHSKWLVLNSPGNPTGAGYSADELMSLAQVLLDYPNLYVIVDDMYEHIRYDGWVFTTLAQVEPRLKHRVLTVNGVSKAYAMTGWRIGYAGGPAALITAMATIQSQSTSNPCSVSQAAAIAALSGPQDFIQDRNTIFQKRRDLVLAAINSIDGMSCLKPQGAFYLYPSASSLLARRTPGGKVLQTDQDVADYLLQHAEVAVVPGTTFGLAPYFRISFATSMEALEQACDRIVTACAQLSR